MNSFSFSVLKTIVCIPCGEMLSFKLAYLSVIPLPEKALISGKRACRSGSKLEASNTSNCSTLPSAFGKEMIVDLPVLLSTTENNSCLKGSIFKVNNLKSLGNDSLATDLSFEILSWLTLFADQNVC